MAPIGPAIGNIGGGGAIGNSNVESADWNDYSGYDRRMPYYHEEKRYEAPKKEERIYGQPPQPKILNLKFNLNLKLNIKDLKKKVTRISLI